MKGACGSLLQAAGAHAPVFGTDGLSLALAGRTDKGVLESLHEDV